MPPETRHALFGKRPGTLGQNLYGLVTGLSASQKYVILLALDMVICGFAIFTAKLLLSSPLWSGATLHWFIGELGGLMMFTGAISAALGLPRSKLNDYETRGILNSTFIALSIAAGGSAFGALMNGAAMDPGLYPVAGMLFLILSVGVRLTLRRMIMQLYRSGSRRLRVLVYGAGQTGRQLVLALSADKRILPAAFLDDEPRLQGLTFSGLRVYKPEDVHAVIKRLGISRIILAMPSVSALRRARIMRELSGTGCEIHSLPSFSDLVCSRAPAPLEILPVDVNDLLERDAFENDLPAFRDSYIERTVLVTGAGGSIGSELCRQIVFCHPKCLVLLDHSEHALFEINRELSVLVPDLEIVPILGSVCNRSLVAGVMTSHKVDIVLHAAAYKHLPMVEENAIEGMRNNVLGTRTVALAAREAGVERFILVSSDKAVRPTSIMGASKRFAEMIVQDLATRSSTTRFAMVRFGNVIGSSGSVIPLFAEQIAKGGPVTLTHPDVTRYFMTLSEAARLVLLAGSFACGGDVFVLDMGRPIAIRDIARKMIERSGLTIRDACNPNGDIEIRVTGLRPGEKLNEELLIGSNMLATPHPRIMRAQEIHPSEIEMAQAFRSLSKAIETRNLPELRATLSRWIERAEPKSNLVGNHPLKQQTPRISLQDRSAEARAMAHDHRHG